jgi:hypothetical protein
MIDEVNDMQEKLRFVLWFLMVTVFPLILVIVAGDSYPNNLILMTASLIVISFAVVIGWVISNRPSTLLGLKLSFATL